MPNLLNPCRNIGFSELIRKKHYEKNNYNRKNSDKIMADGC